MNHKDVQALVKHIKQHISTKPTFKAPKQSVLQDHESFEFVQSDEVGLQVQDGDLMYKRTLDRDLNKLLTS